MPAGARNVGAVSLTALKKRVEDQSPEAEAERARRKLEIAQQIMTDPFLLDFQQETGLLGIFETAQEKQAREEFEDKFLVTPIFLEGRKPMTAAKSVEELSTGEIAVFRQVFETLEKADAGDGGINGSIEAVELQRALLQVKLSVTLDEATEMIATADLDGNGTIDFDEFLECVVNFTAKATTPKLAAHRQLLRTLAQSGRELMRRSSDELQKVPCYQSLRASAASGGARLARVSAAVVAHPVFDQIIIAFIVLVGVATIVQLEFSDEPGARGRQIAVFLLVTQETTKFIFLGEALLKIVAQGAEPWLYFTDKQEGAFNTFDFVVAVASLVSNITVMRLLRLLKIMAKIPKLRTLLLGLVAGVKAVSAIMVLLILLMFLFGIVGVLLFGKNDPAHFGTTERAMVTLFQIATLAGWTEIYDINFWGCDFYDASLYRDSVERISISTSFGAFDGFGCYNPKHDRQLSSIFFFLIYTTLAGFVVLSLFISVITMSMFEIIELKKLEKIKAKQADVDIEGRMRRFLETAESSFAPRLGRIFELPLTAQEAVEVKKNKKWRTRFVDVCRTISDNAQFNQLVILAICAVGVLEALSANGATYAWMRPTQLSIIALFTLEVTVKLIALGRRDYFRDGWNRFDFAIVALSYVDLGASIGPATVLRLLRLLRVVRLLKSAPQLRSVTQSLISAIGDVGNVGL